MKGKREPKQSPPEYENMKTIKSTLTVTAIAALFASSVFAAEPLLTPRAAGSAHKVVAGEVKDANSVYSSTFTGKGAKANYAGNHVVASSRDNPNLLACAAIGKATCNMKPCDGKMVAAACCKK